MKIKIELNRFEEGLILSITGLVIIVLFSWLIAGWKAACGVVIIILFRISIGLIK